MNIYKTCIGCGIKYKDSFSDYCPSCNSIESPKHYHNLNDNNSQTSTRIFSDDGSYSR